MKKVCIIDPSSTEFNRGSFCYAPYLLHNIFKGSTKDKEDIAFVEAFKMEDLDTIPESDLYIVCLWSYPQIEACLTLYQNLPFMFGENNVYFSGYTALIEQLGLPTLADAFGYDLLQNEELLLSAMSNYPNYYKDFKYLLLSDCDMHLKSLEKDELVYPLFLSYGCPNGCSFCPSTLNCGKKRVVIPIEKSISILHQCKRQGIKAIHFTDEDFFFDIHRAYEILQGIAGMGFNLIALGSAAAVRLFIQTYGTDILQEAGMKVIEIGFESGDSGMSKKMGTGKSLSDCEQLASIQHELPFDIFWLVLTFFPGETIQTLNETGKFLRKYGFDESEVVGRLRTNGTKGGLGQFYQPYHGTPLFKNADKRGEFLTHRPVRLSPSYLPNSFLDSVITEIRPERLENALPWLRLYNVHIDITSLSIGQKIAIHLRDLPLVQKVRRAIALTILARMEVIS